MINVINKYKGITDDFHIIHFNIFFVEMKRIKESGAAFRKKKAREEEESRNQGALIKFLIRPDHP